MSAELIKTTIVCVGAGVTVTVSTTKRADPFLICKYQTRATNADGELVAKVFDNTVITTALMSHDALVRMLTTQPAQVKKAL